MPAIFYILNSKKVKKMLRKTFGLFLILLVIMFTILSIAQADTVFGNSAYAANNSNSNTDKIAVRIDIETHDEVYKLQRMGIPIENARLNWVETHLSPERISKLEKLGYNVTLLKTNYPKAGYHDYGQLTAKLNSVNTAYPDITELISIGQSVEGRQIWAFKITDNPDIEENEATIRITGTIHGNEPVGTEMIIYMIDYLSQNYGYDPFVTDLVDNREIWFIPMLNPDGREYQIRYNANWVDLNRNFPVPDGSIGDDLTYEWEPETQAIIDWSNTENFIISTTFHTGALVVNFPWDYSPIPTPDHNMIYEISLGYSELNPPMYNSPVFENGVVWGYYWYPVYGSLQDWSYNNTACLDLTIELYDIKWPSDSTLSSIWDDNRDSMLYLIWKGGTGLSGVVTDAVTGEPLKAKIEVLEIDKPVFTDPDCGDYHRMLLTGDYTIQASCPGYVSQVIPDVHVDFDSLTNLDIQLSPEPTISIYTDKVNYNTGDTMYLGLDIKNPSSALTACVAIWLEDPTGSFMAAPVHAHTANLPAGLDYSNPNFMVFTLPSIPLGTYTWHAAIMESATHSVIDEDASLWVFASKGEVKDSITITPEISEVEIDFSE